MFLFCFVLFRFVLFCLLSSLACVMCVCCVLFCFVFCFVSVASSLEPFEKTKNIGSTGCGQHHTPQKNRTGNMHFGTVDETTNQEVTCGTVAG